MCLLGVQTPYGCVRGTHGDHVVVVGFQLNPCGSLEWYPWYPFLVISLPSAIQETTFNFPIYAVPHRPLMPSSPGVSPKSTFGGPTGSGPWAFATAILDSTSISPSSRLTFDSGLGRRLAQASPLRLMYWRLREVYAYIRSSLSTYRSSEAGASRVRSSMARPFYR